MYGNGNRNVYEPTTGFDPNSPPPLSPQSPDPLMAYQPQLPYGAGLMTSYSGYTSGDGGFMIPIMPMRPAPVNHPASRTKTGAQVLNPAQQIEMLKHRKAPPRFQPIMIIIIVLSLGLAFIGLTMTVISNWPGYSAIGGNPLLTAGPVLLAVGGAIFLVALTFVCVRQRREKVAWEKNFASIASSRAGLMQQLKFQQQQLSMINQSMQHQPHTMAPPSVHSSGKVPTDPHSASSQGRFNGTAKPSTIPAGAKIPGQPSGAADVSFSDTSERSGEVPEPIRPSSRGRPKTTATPPRDTSSMGAMPVKVSVERPERRQRPKQDDRQELATTAGGAGKKEGTGLKRDSQMGEADVYGATHSMEGRKSYVSAGDQLRINIRAQPGTNIHITAGRTSSQPSLGQISGETEI